MGAKGRASRARVHCVGFLMPAGFTGRVRHLCAEVWAEVVHPKSGSWNREIRQIRERKRS